MTPSDHEALKEAIAQEVWKYTGTPDGPTRGVVADQILQLIRSSLPEKLPQTTSRTTEPSGYNFAIYEMDKLLGGDK